MSHVLQRGCVMRLAAETKHLFINLISVYVVIAVWKAVLDRHNSRQPCVIVHGVVRYLERHVQSDRRTTFPADDATSSARNFVAWMGIGYLHLTQHGHKIFRIDLMA
jgi:hypothetical protein